MKFFILLQIVILLLILLILQISSLSSFSSKYPPIISSILFVHLFYIVYSYNFLLNTDFYSLFSSYSSSTFFFCFSFMYFYIYFIFYICIYIYINIYLMHEKYHLQMAGYWVQLYYKLYTEPVTKVSSQDPCVPNPCGPNSNCRPSPHTDEQPVCSCLPNYIGRAPFCRPECTSDAECRSNNACIKQRCQDPCQGSCGSFTTCVVNNHRPICSCLPGYTGDPFTECAPESKRLIITHPSIYIYEISIYKYICVISSPPLPQKNKTMNHHYTISM